jgi:hypothetical protein
LEQTRDSVLRHGERVGRELLNFVVSQQDARARAEKAQAGLVLRQVIVAAVLIAMAASAPRTSTGRSTRYFEIDWWA